MWVHAAQRVMSQALPRRGWVTWVAAEGSLGLALSGTDACLGGNARSSGPHLPEVPIALGAGPPRGKAGWEVLPRAGTYPLTFRPPHHLV